MNKRLILILALGILLAFAATSYAEYDLSGKLYSQYRWTNGSAGVYFNNGNFGQYTSATPYWTRYGREDKKFANFLRSEAELEFNASASKYVKLYLRFKTIFNSDEGTGDGEHSAASWSDDWDDTRGFLKLRGFLIDLKPPVEFIDAVNIGTPMGLPFNKWFLADRRYIDRDNIKGIVFRGHFGEQLQWNAANMWNASYMGPGWNGLNDFRSEDRTMAANFVYTPTDQMILDFNTYAFIDRGIDPRDVDGPYYDPTVADADSMDDANGNTASNVDYINMGFSLNFRYDITDEMTLNALGMFTAQQYDERLDADEDNIADNLAWVNTNTPPHWWGTNTPYNEIGTANAVVNFITSDPFGNGISPKFEFFMLDHNLYTPFGSRREHDMLLMHGGIDPIKYADGDTEGNREHQSLATFLYGGGQSATNYALTDNNFLRLGEDFYESAIGYMGMTFDIDAELDMMSLNGQFNYIMATDNNDGAMDEENDNYEGDDEANAWYYTNPRQFSAMVADLSGKTKVNDYDLGFLFKYGMWEDQRTDDSDIYDDVSINSMVIEASVAKQLTQSLNLEVKPRFQVVNFVEETADGDNEYADSDILIRHKWIYNFGGFDFWVRGQHFIRTHTEEPAVGDAPDDLDMNWSAIHAAFEVKF